MDSPSPASVLKPFTERHWRNLLSDIHDGQVGVIVGSELAIGPEAAWRPTLYEYLAREAMRRLGVDADRLGPRASLLAHEDHHIAVEVASALDAAGVDVWFDKRRLEAGDNFRLVIEKNIEHCSYFVPLISRNTARLEKRFFQREWHKAIDEAKEWPEGYPFIQPIVLDDVDIAAPGVPEAFRHYHARRLGDLPAFIEDARKRIRERRAMRRAG